MNYTHTKILDILSEMEKSLSEGKELAPFDMNQLRDIEISTTDSSIKERILKIRKQNEDL